MVVEKEFEKKIDREKIEVTSGDEVKWYTLDEFIDKNSLWEEPRKNLEWTQPGATWLHQTTLLDPEKLTNICKLNNSKIYGDADKDKG